MKRNTLICMAVCFYTILQAQKSLDILTVSGQGVMPAAYENNYTGKAKESFMYVNLKLPVVLSGTYIWFNDVNYYQYHVKGSETSPLVFDNPLTLYGVIMQTGLITKFKRDNSLIIFFVPRLMGNMNGRAKDNFQYGGILLYEKKYGENLTARYGASYNNELFGPYVVPMVYLDWNVTGKVFVNGMLPIYSKIGYHATEKLDVGIHHLGLVTSFNLTGETVSQNYIERNTIDVSLFAKYRITKNIYIESRLGYSIARSYAQYEKEDKVNFGLPLYKFNDNRVQLNEDFETGLFAQLRLAYSLSLDK